MKAVLIAAPREHCNPANRPGQAAGYEGFVAPSNTAVMTFVNWSNP
jgi:hypothetical protein